MPRLAQHRPNFAECGRHRPKARKVSPIGPNLKLGYKSGQRRSNSRQIGPEIGLTSDEAGADRLPWPVSGRERHLAAALGGVAGTKVCKSTSATPQEKGSHGKKRLRKEHCGKDRQSVSSPESLANVSPVYSSRDRCRRQQRQGKTNGPERQHARIDEFVVQRCFGVACSYAGFEIHTRQTSTRTVWESAWGGPKDNRVARQRRKDSR